jgi:Pregnancy-associated plasma protein-A
MIKFIKMKRSLFLPIIRQLTLTLLFTVPTTLGAQTCALNQPIIVGPYEAPSEHFIIRLYPQFIRKPNTSFPSAAQAQASAKKMIDNMNLAFAEFGISFVFGAGSFCDGGSNMILETNYTVAEDIRSNIPTAVHSDGIDIYVMNVDDVVRDGRAPDRVPSRWFWIFGRENGVWVTETPVPIHELGHTLGLLHVFDNDCSSPCIGNQQNCTGDYVNDTPIVLQNTDCNAILGDNIMSYAEPTTCRTQFTDQQGARMKVHIAEHDNLNGVRVMPTVFTAGSSFAPSNPSGNIIVNSGTLEITQPLNMLPGTSIRVKPGARLNVKSTISGACGGIWQGIIVEGNADLPQTPANQGTVEIYSSGKIEHSRVGIDAGNADALGNIFTGTGGGIVNVSFGKLENNLVGIRFAQYTFQNIANVSKIFYPRFTTTDAYRMPAVQPIMIELNSVVQLGISLGQFKDNRTTCTSQRSRGIIANNAGFRASGCFFENLDLGSFANTLLVGKSFVFSGCRFRRCSGGINSLSTSGLAITGCIFELGRPFACTPTSATIFGAKLQGATNSMLYSGNNFLKLAEDTTPESIVGDMFRSIGGGIDNKVYNNYYHDLLDGSQAEGSNSSTNSGVKSGLRFLCNSYVVDNLTSNWGFPKGVFVLNGSIFSTQANSDPLGQLNQPAGNLFQTGFEHFFNQGAQTQYFFNGTISGHEPTGLTPTNITEVEVNNPVKDYCGTPIAPCDPCPRAVIDQWESEYYQVKNDLAIQPQAKLVLREAYGAAILGSFYLDTEGVSVDSILFWLNEIHSYATRLQMVKHYFFSGDAQSFNSLWSSLLEDYNQDVEKQAELQHISDLFSTLQGKHWDGMLQNEDLVTLHSYLEYCDESAFVAQIILHLHGKSVEVICEETSERSHLKTMVDLYQQKLVLSPNPASNYFIPEGIELVSLGIFDPLNGKKYGVSNPVAGKPIDVSMLPAGFYIIEALSADNVLRSAKLIIIR